MEAMYNLLWQFQKRSFTVITGLFYIFAKTETITLTPETERFWKFVIQCLFSKFLKR